MTSPSERIIRPGWENKTPRSPEDFARAWKESSDRALLLEDIEDYIERHPFHGKHYDRFMESRRMDQSSAQRANSPFTLSYLQQMNLTLWRSGVMLKTDPSLTITMLVTNFLQAIIVSSIFYNLPEATSAFQSRAVLLFFLILMNAFSSILEIINLYAKRKIVEKHARCVSVFSFRVRVAVQRISISDLHIVEQPSMLTQFPIQICPISPQRRSPLFNDCGPAVQDHQRNNH